MKSIYGNNLGGAQQNTLSQSNNQAANCFETIRNKAKERLDVTKSLEAFFGITFKNNTKCDDLIRFMRYIKDQKVSGNDHYCNNEIYIVYLEIKCGIKRDVAIDFLALCEHTGVQWFSSFTQSADKLYCALYDFSSYNRNGIMHPELTDNDIKNAIVDFIIDFEQENQPGSKPPVEFSQLNLNSQQAIVNKKLRLIELYNTNKSQTVEILANDESFKKLSADSVAAAKDIFKSYDNMTKEIANIYNEFEKHLSTENISTENIESIYVQVNQQYEDLNRKINGKIKLLLWHKRDLYDRISLMKDICKLICEIKKGDISLVMRLTENKLFTQLFNHSVNDLNNYAMNFGVILLMLYPNLKENLQCQKSNINFPHYAKKTGEYNSLFQKIEQSKTISQGVKNILNTMHKEVKELAKRNKINERILSKLYVLIAFAQKVIEENEKIESIKADLDNKIQVIQQTLISITPEIRLLEAQIHKSEVFYQENIKYLQENIEKYLSCKKDEAKLLQRYGDGESGKVEEQLQLIGQFERTYLQTMHYHGIHDFLRGIVPNNNSNDGSLIPPLIIVELEKISRKGDFDQECRANYSVITGKKFDNPEAMTYQKYVERLESLQAGFQTPLDEKIGILNNIRNQEVHNIVKFINDINFILQRIPFLFNSSNIHTVTNVLQAIQPMTLQNFVPRGISNSYNNIPNHMPFSISSPQSNVNNVLLASQQSTALLYSVPNMSNSNTGIPNFGPFNTLYSSNNANNNIPSSGHSSSLPPQSYVSRVPNEVPAIQHIVVPGFVPNISNSNNNISSFNPSSISPPQSNSSDDLAGSITNVNQVEQILAESKLDNPDVVWQLINDFKSKNNDNTAEEQLLAQCEARKLSPNDIDFIMNNIVKINNQISVSLDNTSTTLPQDNHDQSQQITKADVTQLLAQYHADNYKAVFKLLTSYLNLPDTSNVWKQLSLKSECTKIQLSKNDYLILCEILGL